MLKKMPHICGKVHINRHFNLNIIGKWRTGSGDFQSPDIAEYEAETPDKNVIYVPRDPHRDIGILVESRKQGPKNCMDPLLFEVSDWCATDAHEWFIRKRFEKSHTDHGYFPMVR
jgi:hypothetical protein